MQFKALYNGYIFNSINDLAIFIGFRAILDYLWKKLKNIVIFYKYFQIFFLLIKIENYCNMQFKALFTSFKTNIWNIYAVILILKILRIIKYYRANSKSRFTNCIMSLVRVRLGVAYESQNNDKIHNYTHFNKIFVLIYILFPKLNAW